MADKIKYELIFPDSDAKGFEIWRMRISTVLINGTTQASVGKDWWHPTIFWRRRSDHEGIWWWRCLFLGDKASREELWNKSFLVYHQIRLFFGPVLASGPLKFVFSQSVLIVLNFLREDKAWHGFESEEKRGVLNSDSGVSVRMTDDKQRFGLCRESTIELNLNWRSLIVEGGRRHTRKTRMKNNRRKRGSAGRQTRWRRKKT